MSEKRTQWLARLRGSVKIKPTRQWVVFGRYREFAGLKRWRIAVSDGEQFAVTDGGKPGESYAGRISAYIR